jgi:hypothetical protein
MNSRRKWLQQNASLMLPSAAAWCVVEYHRRRVSPAPGSVFARDRPRMALLRLAAARVEDRHGGLVGEQPRRGQQDLPHAAHHGHELHRARAGPVGQNLAADLDPLPRQDLRLAIQRQVVGVARDQDVGDRCLGRHAPLDQAGRCGFLQDHARAGPAGQPRALGHDDAELGGDHVQPLRGIGADLDQWARAAADKPVDAVLPPRLVRFSHGCE